MQRSDLETRIAFTMQLLPGKAAEYQQRHDAIWPELQGLLRQAGIRQYSIFLDEKSGILFAYLLMADPSNLDRLPQEPIMQRWWQYMSDLMETNPDHSPVTRSLQQVFFLP